MLLPASSYFYIKKGLDSSMQIKLAENLRSHVCTCITSIDLELFRNLKFVREHQQHYIEELAASIKKNGLYSPLVIGVLPDGMTGLLSGYARMAAIFLIIKEAYPDSWKAELSYTYIPTYSITLKDKSDAVPYVIVECQPRMEFAAGEFAIQLYNASQEFNKTAEELGRLIGCSGRRIREHMAVGKMLLGIRETLPNLGERIWELAHISPQNQDGQHYLLITELKYLHLYLLTDPDVAKAEQKIAALLDGGEETKVKDWFTLLEDA